MESLNNLLNEWNIVLSDYQIDQFKKYYELLIEWNSFMNLTSITDKNEVILKHFADSIALFRYLNLSDESLIDVGTGAGFPGIPLKIVCPKLKVTLVDSLNKRVNFLNEVIGCLNLEDIFTVHSRAEDLAHNDVYREKFDYCVPRAVANLSTLSELCLPFVKTGGYFIPYKSEKTSEEISAARNAIAILGGKLDKVEEYYLPNTDMLRTLVFISKKKSSPKKYPRKAGTPTRDPIL